MLIDRTTAANIGAYFHEENGKTELRIPINRRRAAIVKEVIRVAGGKARCLAGELATAPLSMLDEISEGESEHLAHLAINGGDDYETILKMLLRFEGAGWIRDIWRRDILEEMRERLADDEFEPEDAEWARGVLWVHGVAEAA